MVGPLVYDIAKQRQAELRAERDMDRLAAQVSSVPHKNAPALDLGRFFPTPTKRHSGAALS